MTFDLGALIASAVGVLFSGVGYLLAKRDTAHEDAIKELFSMHKEDAARLQELTVKIAENHYPKVEINAMLDQFKKYLDQRFDQLEMAVRTIKSGGERGRHSTDL